MQVEFNVSYYFLASVTPVSPVSQRASSPSAHRNTHVTVTPASPHPQTATTTVTTSITSHHQQQSTPTHHRANSSGGSTTATSILGSLTSPENDTASLVTSKFPLVHFYYKISYVTLRAFYKCRLVLKYLQKDITKHLLFRPDFTKYSIIPSIMIILEPSRKF